MSWRTVTTLHSHAKHVFVTLQVRELRQDLDIHISGFDPPKPVKTFGQAGFDHLLLGAIKKAGYEAPTAIQAQGLPAALSGRDVLVSALTASNHDICMVIALVGTTAIQARCGLVQN